VNLSENCDVRLNASLTNLRRAGAPASVGGLFVVRRTRWSEESARSTFQQQQLSLVAERLRRLHSIKLIIMIGDAGLDTSTAAAPNIRYPMRQSELVQSFEYEVLRMRGTSDEYHFRVDVFRRTDSSPNPYYIRLWQMIDTQLELTEFKLPNGRAERATKVLLAEDQSLCWAELAGRSVEEVLASLEAVIGERFEVLPP
jgi:hypothetical protein